MTSHTLHGKIIDLFQRRIYSGAVTIRDGIIIEIAPIEGRFSRCILPGFIDAHIHIESSMMVPAEFARMATVHGTVGAVADPHEIANVLGVDGVRYMLENGRHSPLKFSFAAPSCVPATELERSGAVIDENGIETLFARDGLKYLGEMMNFPGVLQGDPHVIAKLKTAQKYGLPIDGHAPGLTGADLHRYIAAGVSTDHEAYRYDEGLEKVKAGMKILIREGTGAKNFRALHRLIAEYPEMCMFCCDDKHPHDLLEGHIDTIVKMALNEGHDLFNVLQCATVNPAQHYGLNVGLLRPGDPADLIIIDNIEDFNILETYIQGELVAEKGRSLLPQVPAKAVNCFRTTPKTPVDFRIPAGPGVVRVIVATDGELITEELRIEPKVEQGAVVADIERDILKITVVNRYQDNPPVMGLIKNFGLCSGAIAASVAHDSHNIVAIGTSDEMIAQAINLIIRHQGGFAVVDGLHEAVLPLPVAGLMSLEEGPVLAGQYADLVQMARDLGSGMRDPFMTMGFMSLGVIPELKLTAQGLFDGKTFQQVGLFV